MSILKVTASTKFQNHGWIVNDFPESKSEPSSRSAMFGAALADLSHRLWRDQSGFVFSIEMLLLGTVVVIGLIVGHTTPAAQLTIASSSTWNRPTKLSPRSSRFLKLDRLILIR